MRAGLFFAAAWLAAAATVLTATPVVSGVWNPAVAAAGAAGTAVLVLAAVHAWRTAAPSRRRTATAAVALFAFAALAAGALSDPVVVDGRVALSTSATSQQVRYIEGLRDDMYSLRDDDARLGAPEAEAWADRRTLAEGKNRATAVAEKYQAVLSGDGPPAGELADPTRRTMAAAYTLVKAYEAKEALTKEDAPALRDDLAGRRAQFADELSAASASLTEAVRALNLPVQLATR